MDHLENLEIEHLDEKVIKFLDDFVNELYRYHVAIAHNYFCEPGEEEDEVRDEALRDIKKYFKQYMLSDDADHAAVWPRIIVSVQDMFPIIDPSSNNYFAKKDTFFLEKGQELLAELAKIAIRAKVKENATV